MIATIAGMKRTKQIRVDEDVARMLAQLAALKAPGQNLPDFTSAILRPILRKQLPIELERARNALDEPEQKPEE